MQPKRRFWARVHIRRSIAITGQLRECQALVDEMEVIVRWKEHYKGLHKDMEELGQDMSHSELGRGRRGQR